MSISITTTTPIRTITVLGLIRILDFSSSKYLTRPPDEEGIEILLFFDIFKLRVIYCLKRFCLGNLINATFFVFYHGGVLD